MKRTGMRKIKEIIKLHCTTDLSLRKIAAACNTSRPIVTKFIAIFKTSGLTYDDIKELDEDSIHDMFFTDPGRLNKDDRYSVLSSKFEYLSNELKKKHVTIQKLWEEYIEENPEGYSKSRFSVHFARWRKSHELTMHIEHKAGDRMFVDFTGKKLYLTDKNTQKKFPVEIFIAILPASQYTFVCAVETQKTKDWIKSTEEAFWYFGGVPNIVTPDCYKSAVTRYDKYDPEINPLYSLFARHYNTVIIPARPAHPKDKALVENAVRIVYYWIYASLRNQVFYSLSQLNRAILQELEKYNSKKMQLSRVSRLELFKKTEQNKLKPLPLTLYEHKKCSRTTIQSNYHVKLLEDKKYYSVPYMYYTQSIQNNKKKIKAQIYYTDNFVEIYFKGTRIAVHKRNYSHTRYITNPEHMPEKHKAYLERLNPEKMIELAGSKGEYVSDFISKIKEQKHSEQLYNICRGLVYLSKNYGCERLNKACRKAIYYRYYTYRVVKDMLESKNEDFEEEKKDLIETKLPEHSNIRGNSYFKNILKELNQ